MTFLVPDYDEGIDFFVERLGWRLVSDEDQGGGKRWVVVEPPAGGTALLLARASTREREIAIRAAIGAGRARILRQFLAESVLLALLGGTAGIALAGMSLAIVKRVGSPALPRLQGAHIDASVLIFALSISLLTGILFGLAPGLTFIRRNLDETLKHDARGSSSAAQLRVRALLVASEVALTIVLLIGAGLVRAGLAVQRGAPASLLTDSIIGAAAGYLVFAAIGAIFFRLRGQEGLGLGDAKLLAAAGAWLGWQMLPSVVLVAALGGLAQVALAGRLWPAGAADRSLAFGPWLALAFFGLWLLSGG